MAQYDVGDTTAVEMVFDQNELPLVQNVGDAETGADIAIGRTSGVTFATGIVLEKGESLAFQRPLVMSGGKLYAIAETSGTADVRTMGI